MSDSEEISIEGIMLKIRARGFEQGEKSERERILEIIEKTDMDEYLKTYLAKKINSEDTQ